jgi:hypothetical protein
LLKRFADLLSMESPYLLVLWSVLGVLAATAWCARFMGPAPQRGAAQDFAAVVCFGALLHWSRFSSIVDRSLQPWLSCRRSR